MQLKAKRGEETKGLFRYNGFVPFPHTNDYFPSIAKPEEGHFGSWNGREAERSFI